MSPSIHRILLVDDHPLMRRGLRQLLELQMDLQVTGEAANGIEALQQIESANPDLIILDSNMPQCNGIETLKKLRSAGFRHKIMMYTVSDDEQNLRQALKQGADGYILKDIEPEELIQNIREILQGDIVISSALTPVLARSLRLPAAEPSTALTVREREVLSMMVAGYSNKVIGSKLGITEGTVKIHVKNLLHKLGLRSRVEAVVWAMKQSSHL